MARDNLKNFKFWCQKVLPLVYEDSLSYYEVLCKVTDYLNDVIVASNEDNEEITKLRNELTIVQNWIKNFNTYTLEQYIAEYIQTAVYFGLSDAGYFVAYIPKTWDNIKFGTTGLDVNVPIQPQFGHLVLSY